MNRPEHNAQAFTELFFALAEGEGVRPPDHLGANVLAAALATRPAGQPVDGVAPIGPVEAFRRAVASLDELLSDLSPGQWRRPALRGLDVQGLIGHLIGVEHHFLAALGEAEGPFAEADHVSATDEVAAAEVGRESAATLAAWRAATAKTMVALTEALASTDGLEEPIALYGVHLPLRLFLVVRSFELWTHEEDVRRATGRGLAAPDSASLRLMTDLAVAMLPTGMARVGRASVGRSARLVLTGPGGGVWRTGLSPADSTADVDSPDVRIVVPAADFCRVVANRYSADAVGAVVTGEVELARDLFAGAASLALD